MSTRDSTSDIVAAALNGDIERVRDLVGGHTIARLLKVEEAARELAISTRQVWRLIGSGELRKVTAGRATRVTREPVEKFIARGAVLILAVWMDVRLSRRAA
mgnify:CR=1 FL=1